MGFGDPALQKPAQPRYRVKLPPPRSRIRVSPSPIRLLDVNRDAFYSLAFRPPPEAHQSLVSKL